MNPRAGENDAWAGAARAAWLHGWRLAARYHRYRVDGLQHITEAGRPVLIVGYHGRPIAHDLCMLCVRLHDEVGQMPHAIFHEAFARAAPLRAVLRGVGGVTADDAAIAAAVAAGEHIIVTPGSTMEGCRTFLHRHRVNWGPRTGYLKLALRHRLPIVPVAGRGTDWTYIGLNDGYAWGKRLRIPAGLPAWVGVGVGGLWPLALPWPVVIDQRVGPPIELPTDLDPKDREAMGALHRQVQRAVQALLD